MQAITPYLGLCNENRKQLILIYQISLRTKGDISLYQMQIHRDVEVGSSLLCNLHLKGSLQLFYLLKVTLVKGGWLLSCNF